MRARGRVGAMVNKTLNRSFMIITAALCLSSVFGQTAPPDNATLLKQGFAHAQHPILVDAHQLYIAPEIVRADTGFEAVSERVLGLALRRSFEKVNGVWVFRRLSSAEALQGQTVPAAFQAWLEGLSSDQFEQLIGSGLRFERPTDVPDVFRYVFTSGEIASSLMRGSPITVSLSAGLVARVQGDTRNYVVRGERNIGSPRRATTPPVIPEWIRAPYEPSSVTIFESPGEILSLKDLAHKIREEHGLRLYYDARLEDFPMYLQGEFSEDQLIQALAVLGKTLTPRFEPQESHEPEYATFEGDVIDRLLAAQGFPTDLLEAIAQGETMKASEWRNRFEVLRDDYRFNLVPDAETSFGLALTIGYVCDEERSGNASAGRFILHVKKR